MKKILLFILSFSVMSPLYGAQYAGNPSVWTKMKHRFATLFCRGAHTNRYENTAVIPQVQEPAPVAAIAVPVVAKPIPVADEVDDYAMTKTDYAIKYGIIGASAILNAAELSPRIVHTRACLLMLFHGDYSCIDEQTYVMIMNVLENPYSCVRDSEKNSIDTLMRAGRSAT